MKKTLLILVLALAALSACRKSGPADEPAAAMYDLSQLRFDFKVQYPTETKAVKSGWTNGDKIFIFFADVTSHYMTLSYDGTAWDTAPTVHPGEGSPSLESTGLLTAIYLPYGNTAEPSYSGSSWSFSGNYADSYYLAAEKVTYQITDMENAMSTLGAVLYMEMPSGYAQFFIPDDDANATVRVACNLMKPGGLTGIASDGTIAENTSGEAGGWITGYNATVGSAKGYYVSGKPVSNPGPDCYFALETESAASYKHYYKWRSTPIAVRGAYRLLGLASWSSVSSTDYVSLAGYRWCTVDQGASTPWAAGTPYASDALPSGVSVPTDDIWTSLLSAAKTRWVSMTVAGTTGSLVVDKSDESHYLFLSIGDYWSLTASHYLHLEEGGVKQLKTTDPPGTAYVRPIKYQFDGGFTDPPVEGIDI